MVISVVSMATQVSPSRLLSRLASALSSLDVWDTSKDEQPTSEKWHKRHHQRKGFPQEALQSGPKLFNRVEFRGIRWKKQKCASGILGNTNKTLLGMERGIIHYNYAAFVQRWQKLIEKPELEKVAVHGSAVL